MKKIVLFFLFFSLNLIPYFVQAETCSLSSENPLRGVMSRYARACGAEGDSSLRYSTDCSDYNTNPATASDRALYDRECAFVGDTTYSVCGCLRHKDCYSEDALFRELSCTGTRSVPPTPTPATRPDSMPSNPCGNGVRDAGEECDPMIDMDCSASCKWKTSFCGDNRVDVDRGEECEPPATRHDGWECNEECKVKNNPPPPSCANGIIDQASEECEPAGSLTCDRNCKRIRSCGDGIVDTDLGEECERPNTARCDAHCKTIPNLETVAPFCGDGVIQTSSGEECEGPGIGLCDMSCHVMHLFLEGSGLHCNLDTISFVTPSSSSLFVLFSSFGSLIAFRMARRKK